MRFQQHRDPQYKLLFPFWLILVSCRKFILWKGPCFLFHIQTGMWDLRSADPCHLESALFFGCNVSLNSFHKFSLLFLRYFLPLFLIWHPLLLWMIPYYFCISLIPFSILLPVSNLLLKFFQRLRLPWPIIFLTLISCTTCHRKFPTTACQLNCTFLNYTFLK